MHAVRLWTSCRRKQALPTDSMYTIMCSFIPPCSLSNALMQSCMWLFLKLAVALDAKDLRNVHTNICQEKFRVLGWFFFCCSVSCCLLQRSASEDAGRRPLLRPHHRQRGQDHQEAARGHRQQDLSLQVSTACLTPNTQCM